MPHTIGQSVLVLVDEANFAGSTRSFGRKADWLILRDYLANPEEQRSLIEMVGYVGLPPETTDEFKRKRASKMSFVTWLRTNGFLVVLKEGRPTEPGKYSANVDVMMGIDGLDLARRLNPDIVVLVTGDHEFAHLAEVLRRSGIRVEIASVNANLGAQLRAAANAVIDLEPVINQMPPLNTNGHAEAEAAVIGSLDNL